MRLALEFALLAAAIIAMRIYPTVSARGRRQARRLYTNASLPQPLRNVIPLAGVWALVCALCAASLTFSTPVGKWMIVAAMAAGLAAFLLSYRTPAPFLPGWLRNEVDRGETMAARPTRGDWLLFWLVLPFAVVAPLAAAYLIVVAGEGLTR